MLGIISIENPTEEQIKEFFKDTNISNKRIKNEKVLLITKAWNKYLHLTHYSIVHSYQNNNIYQNNHRVGWNEVQI